MSSEVKTDKLSQRGSSGIVITDDIKLSSGKAIKQADGTDLLTEAGLLTPASDVKLASGTAIKNASGTALLGEDGALGSGVTGAGSWVKLGDTVEADNYGTVEVGTASLITTAYRVYKIIGSNIKIGTDEQNGRIRALIGDPGSASTSSYYDKIIWDSECDGGTTLTVQTGRDADTWPQFFGAALGDQAAEASNVEITLYDPASTATYTLITVQNVMSTHTPHLEQRFCSGRYKQTAALTGLQFYSTSGSIVSGYFTLYGLVT